MANAISLPPAPPLPSLHLAATPRAVRWSVRLLVAFFVLLIPTLLLSPWTQTVHGTGRAVAFNPVQRPQFVVSPIEGRVRKWHVVEGDQVRAGQRLVDLIDNDPRRLERLEEQELLALQRLTLADGRVTEQRARLRFVTDERDILLAEADARVAQAEAQLLVFQQELERARFDLIREEQNYARLYRLSTSKVGEVVAKDQVEEAERRRDLAKAQVPLAEARITAQKRAIEQAKLQKGSTDTRTNAQIQSEKIALQAAESEQAAVRQQLNAVRTDLERQRNQFVEAPVDGTVFRLLANAEAGGQLVRPGERLAVLVPDVKPGADPLTSGGHPGIVAELYIDGNDLPLVRRGDRVLVQFEGWAAVQFAAYPEAAAGTFEGRVYLVDPTADDLGRFRILVEPAPTEPNGRPARPWPDPDYLRQGVRAQGWVIAQQVTAGYELWRLLNGFPPAREVKPKDVRQPLGPVGGK